MAGGIVGGKMALSDRRPLADFVCSQQTNRKAADHN
jgi:hypothetical protein